MSDELLVGQSMFHDEYFIDASLRKSWNEFKMFIWKPWEVTSVWRTPEVNDAVGGTPNSYHIHGKALDVKLTTEAIENVVSMIYAGDSKFYSWLSENNVVELIIYPSHLHYAVDPEKPGEHLVKINGKTLDENQVNFRQFIRNVEDKNNANVFLKKVVIVAGCLYLLFNFKRIFHG